MAQRTIHYAICNELLKNSIFKDNNRIKIGMLLPDANNFDNMSRNDVHFVKTIGMEKEYNLSEFRSKFLDKIKSDDLFLGYYLHLIQDMIYRKFLYEDYKIWPKNLEEKMIWYNDYHILNKYIINKYQLKDDIQLPKNFENEDINDICRFDVEEILSDFQNDFTDNTIGNTKLIKESLMNEYIKLCVDICNNEINALKNNKPLIKEELYKYSKH